MKSIYKYTLDPRNAINAAKPCGIVIRLDLPADARPLSVGEQGGQIVLWAVVDLDDQKAQRSRYFRIFGTGWAAGEEILADADFIGTVQLRTGLVFHVFVARDER